MNIELTINAGPELIRFAEIIAGGISHQTLPPIAAPAIIAEPVITSPGTTRTRKATAPVVEAKAEEKTEEAAIEEKEEPTDTKTPTKEEIRSLCSEKARKGKRDEVKALIASFKLESLSDLKESDYPSFFKAVTAIEV